MNSFDHQTSGTLRIFIRRNKNDLIAFLKGIARRLDHKTQFTDEVIFNDHHIILVLNINPFCPQVPLH